MQRMNFILGETRYVRLIIKTSTNEEVVIRNATYTLIAEAGETEATGDCIVLEDMIMALITPQKIGRYKLMVSYEVGYERLIEVVEVAVI